MAKFKVGDRVVRTSHIGDYFIKGLVYVVGRVDHSSIGLTDVFGGSLSFNEDHFDFAPPEPVKATAPHKHAALIKQWADGAKIQVLSVFAKAEWLDIEPPHWQSGRDYRVKPEVKPDGNLYCRTFAYELGGYGITDISNCQIDSDNLKLTFDGETGKLKAAEVITQG